MPYGNKKIEKETHIPTPSGVYRWRFRRKLLGRRVYALKQYPQECPPLFKTFAIDTRHFDHSAPRIQKFRYCCELSLQNRLMPKILNQLVLMDMKASLNFSALLRQDEVLQL